MYTAEEFVTEWNRYAPKKTSIGYGEMVEFGEPRGYSEEEIASAESHLDRNFPLAYREFLKALGKTTIASFSGCDTGIDDELRTIRIFREIATRETGGDPFPEDAYVFLSRDEICHYFLLSDPSDDPQTWRWDADADVGVQHYETGGIWELPLYVLSEIKKGNYSVSV